MEIVGVGWFVNGDFNTITICDHVESDKVWSFMSLSGRGMSNIVKRNIIRGIRWNNFGNKKVTGSTVDGNKNMFIGSDWVKEHISLASSIGAGISAGARVLASSSSELTLALVVEPALWMEPSSAVKGGTG